ncbi:MAG: hypothetical protein ETSY2_03020 [Candidatus Entotheonella gemina]|uniref:Uncharacterized protein n=1 Tax=Candidatus Entotheonella gemina TaxID=1429439 RepID=W4MG18_9BACT|nr:MAG: hypothetical protein ETSY2_03020 [Candidatus Entotheonella gemina]
MFFAPTVLRTLTNFVKFGYRCKLGRGEIAHN